MLEIRGHQLMSASFRSKYPVFTGSQHAFISEKVWTDCGQVVLGCVDEVVGL